MSTGSSTIHNALLKVENVLHKFGRQLNQLPEQENDLSVYESFIRENTVLLDKPARTLKNMEFAGQSLHINESTTNRFLKILYRVAKGNEGVSRQERIFIYQFWSAFQKN